MMKWEGNPDTREWRIRMKYPKAYERMRRVIYPQMRAVDFRFNLHRRGMKQDTVYTTEVDAEYMHAVELLKKRRYEEALTILRPYEDRNTALAYMSLGYDAAAYRILRAEPDAASTPPSWERPGFFVAGRVSGRCGGSGGRCGAGGPARRP